jgi:Ca-activated chloride channel homolog
VDLSQLHFAHPLWLWGGIAIPLLWVVFFLFYRAHSPLHQLEKFIDSHLLPYLLVNRSGKGSSHWKTLLLWSAVWSCLLLALAGPRWNFREMDTFSRDQSLVVLLDLSESMNATDIKPSRLVRAKQKIEDLLSLSKGVKIGLIAFAADPHIITPITEDKETIRHLLPSLETDLVYRQGSRLSSALDRASTMLEAEPGNNKALLVISDGGFEDASAITTVKKLADKGIVIHVMGVGTAEGAPLQDHKGNVIKKNGAPILSKLEREILSEISTMGKGRYLQAHYSDREEAIILKELEARADALTQIGKKNRIWDERFYLLILPALPIILWWFRRGYIFPMVLILSTLTFELEAVAAREYFNNSEELGKQAFDGGDYEAAINAFQDPYRKGIAYYRAGNFAEAEKMFSQSSRLEVASNAAYNLGNTLVQQQKLKEAIAAYEDLLEKWPDHTKAKENLELVKKMLDQQKQDSSNSDNSDSQEDQDKSDSENEDSSESKGSNRSKDKEQHRKKGQQQNNEDPADGQQEESQGMEEEREPQKENDKDLEEQKGRQDAEAAQKEGQEAKAPKSQEDQDADLWLNRISNDPKAFLKNKFYIESKKNGTTEGIDPW